MKGKKNACGCQLITKDESIIIEENKPHREIQKRFIVLKKDYMYMN
jgi:hypothetical protein